MIYIYLFTMAIGLIHPYMKWAWVGSILIISMGAGFANGHVTARCMKMAGLTDWVGGATVAAFFYPMFSMCCFVIIDLIEWAEYNVYEWPITTLVIYGVIWTVVNIIACYFGALDGYSRPPFATIRKANSVPRKIPA
jgi:hypothetical protein